MDPILHDWLSMMVRWLHVIAGMGWIGSSFYFIHLDLSLRKREGLPAGVQGEAWQVHGGGFYHMVKYMVAPAKMPDELTWFKWEAYATWLSGFSLLVIVYYLGADLYLIDSELFPLTQWQAIGLGFGSLVLAWLGYEALCRSPIGKNEGLLAAFGFVFLVVLTWGFTQVFSGRGAFTQIGALIGTMMVANVFAIIIPNQKKTIAELVAGRAPNPFWGWQGKQRSVHNNYLTLPVIFLMISNHYPLLFATRYNWIIVAIILALGGVIRHFYNCRHAGKPQPWWTWGVAVVGMVAVFWLSTMGPPERQSSALPATPVTFAAAEDVVMSRCSMCHSGSPVWAGIAAAPKDIQLDTPERIHRFASLIDKVAVRSSSMPPGNITEMTAEERSILAAWLAAGAKLN
jgi:uncharacterized membrane protein